MALTQVTLLAGGSVQLDDGTHTSVYVQNQGDRHCVIEPGGYTLRAGQVSTFAVTYGTPLMAYSSSATTLGFQVGAVAVAPAGGVASVAGKTGIVSLANGDVGLGNVDNTADANKPVSAAQAAALAAVQQIAPGLKLYNPRGLRRWRGALADALFGRAPIVALGDSITFGVGADDVNAANTTLDATQGWVGQLRTLLAKTYGDPGEGFVFMNDARYVSANTGVTSASTGPLHNSYKYTSGQGVTIAVPAGLTSVGIIQWENSGNTTGTYTLDGGGSTSLGATAGTDTYAEHSITVTSGSTHTIVISGPASTQMYIAGVVFRNGTAGVPVHRIGTTGYTAADPLGGVSNGALVLSSAQQDRALRSCFQWGAAPGLIVMSFLANDWSFQKPTFTFTAGTTPSGSSTIPAASGAPFDVSDIGKAVTGTGIAGSTTVGGVSADGTTLTITNPTTAIVTGNTITVTTATSQAGVTAALFSTWLAQFITTAVSNGWCILLLGEPQNNAMATATPAPPSTEAAYRTAMKTLAQTTDHVAYLDVSDVWGTATLAQANGLQISSSVHPKRRGHGDIARIVREAITLPLGENAPSA